MSTCNTYEVNSDKQISELGSKNISSLSGTKGGAEGLIGETDKNESLLGQKNISQLLGEKNIDDLEGTKYISTLSGTKLVSSLFGAIEKYVTLQGTACEGTWYIHADTTYFTADNTEITADNFG